MIEETAIVQAIEHNGVRVATSKQSSCSGCNQSDSCSTSLLSKYFGTKSMVMFLKTDQSLIVGDTVKVGLDEGVFLRLTMLVYLLPLCVLIFAALAGQFLAESLNVKGEALVIICGIVGFAASFYGLKTMIKSKIKAEYLNPVLLQKV